MMNKNVIISGISGQDGAYLAKYLMHKNYNIIGLVRSKPNFIPLNLKFLGIKKVEIKRCNLLDKNEVNNLIDFYKPLMFFNLAAESSVGRSFLMPYQSINFNFNSVLNLLNSIKDFSPKTRFFNASSSEIFGNISKSELPITLETIKKPLSPYGLSKLSCNQIIDMYKFLYDLHLVSGITFNHESCLRKKYFVFNKIFNHVISLKNGNRSILELGNIDIVREWGYAPDYIQPMYESLRKKDPKNILICSGKKISLKELIKIIYSKVDFDYKDFTKVNPLFFRKNELLESFGDPKMIKDYLGWEYKLTYDQLVDKLIDDYFKFAKWYEKSFG